MPYRTGGAVETYTKTFDQLYGTSTSFDVGKFVWAGNLEYNLVVPAANLVGTMFTGSFPLNTLFATGGSGSTTTSPISVAQLISIADNAVAMQKSFTLTGAVVNNSLCSAMRQRIDMNAFDHPFTFLGAERCSYVVLQTPAQSITTTDRRPFSLIGRICGNFGFYPTAKDAFLYNMFKLNPYHFGKSVLDEVPYNALRVRYPPPTNQKELESFLQKLSILASETGGWVSSGANQSVFPMSDLVQAFDNFEESKEVLPLLLHQTELTRKHRLALAVKTLQLSHDELCEYIDVLDPKTHDLQILPGLAAPLASAAMSFIVSKIPMAIAYAKSKAPHVIDWIGKDVVTKIAQKGADHFKKKKRKPKKKTAEQIEKFLKSEMEKGPGKPRKLPKGLLSVNQAP